MLEKLVRLSLLFDFYGPLLTEKQQQAIELYYHHDLSLAEIADRFGISRQAVYDLLRRAEAALEEYESKLHLIQRFWDQRAVLERLGASLTQLDHDFRSWSASGNPDLFKSILENLETGRQLVQKLLSEG